MVARDILKTMLDTAFAPKVRPVRPRSAAKSYGHGKYSGAARVSFIVISSVALWWAIFWVIGKLL